MLDNLFFSLNCVAPFFFLIVIGYLLARKAGVRRAFFQDANSFVFNISLPVTLFLSIAAPGKGGINGPFLLYLFVTTIISFFLVWIATELVYKDKTVVGTIVQGAFRGNASLVGVPMAVAASGDAAGQLAAISLAVIVPIYNVFSVIILTVRGKEPARPNISVPLKSIVRNRLIIGILLGIPFMVFGIPLPTGVTRTLGYIGQLSTPLGLLSIGGLFTLTDATSRLRPAIFATTIKILLLPAAGLLVSCALGFRGDELLVIFLLFGTPAAISSYAMAASMGGDGPLASNILILTTILSSFVFAVGIYALRTLGLI